MSDTNQSAAAPTDQTSASSTAKQSATKKSAAKNSSSRKSTAKKSTAKKSTPKSTAKKSTAKKSTTKTSTAKKTATKKTAAKKTPTKRISKSAATSRAAAGKAAVARAASATQKPVAAGRALVEKAGDRVADLSRAVLTPSTKFFAQAPVRAQAIVAHPEALRSLADKVTHSESGRSGPFGEVVDDFKTLGRLVAAYSRGDYRDIPLDSLIMVIAGLAYVVSPIDLIPDAIPVAGYADDVVAVSFVIRQVHHELAAFREWEATGSSKT